jgi:hypothetical protein
VLEGDALEVIQNVLKSEERWGSYEPIIQDAKLPLSLQEENLWEASCPPSIQSFVLAEQFAD